MFKLSFVQVTLLFLWLFNASYAIDPNIKLTFSTNTTTVPVGQPFTARCDVANWVLKRSITYRVWLCTYLNQDRYCLQSVYYIKVDDTGAVQIIPFKPPATANNLTIFAASCNQSSFVWTVVSHTAEVKPLICSLDNNDNNSFYFDINSNAVAVTFSTSITPPSPTTLPPPSTASLIFSTNATIVSVGQPFTARCDLVNLTPAKGTTFRVWLCDNYSSRGCYGIASFDIIVYAFGNVQIDAFEPFTNHNLTFAPASYNQSSLAWTLVSHTADVRQFYCNLDNNTINGLEIYSNKVTVTITATSPTTPTPPPSTSSLTFSTNITKVQPGQPFMATCTISNFSPTSSGYRVRFYQQADGLLATYEVDSSSGRALLTGERKANIQVHAGARFALPNFDLVVRQYSSHASHYWCELEDLSSKTQVISSPKWPNIPLVDFYSTALGSERIGNCSISGFEPASKVYSVQFFSRFGPDEKNLMATYSVKPNSPPEFFSEPLRTEFTSITHGVVLFPNFQVRVKSSHYSGSWFCVLLVGSTEDPDNSSNQKYRSNAVTF